jgi:predicted outer membrane repeat protein
MHACSFSLNRASDHGGGLYVEGPGTAYVSIASVRWVGGLPYELWWGKLDV